MQTYDGFKEKELNYKSPFEIFYDWFEEAKTEEINDPDAMSLATVNDDGQPNVRMVLLKKIDHGFVFFSNKNSQKGIELNKNKSAAVCFHWKSIRKQVRIKGEVSIIAPIEADNYFDTRPRGSRIGAIVSKQSSVLSGPDQFSKEYSEFIESMEGKEIIRPDYWVGYRIIPNEIEFWLNSNFRLHQRLKFKLQNKSWTRDYLYP